MSSDTFPFIISELDIVYISYIKIRKSLGINFHAEIDTDDNVKDDKGTILTRAGIVIGCIVKEAHCLYQV